MISLIAAIGQKNELGLRGKLVFHIKEDMEFFRNTTLGHPVLMGRRTFESIGKPLKGRTNFVVSSDPDSLPDSVEPVRHLKQFLENWQDSEEELFVIGGAMVYFESLKYARHLYLTEVDATVDADTFFPIFDKSNYTSDLIKKGKEDDLAFTISKYTRK